jgi:endonuclease/exonuclease/phosphatase family metal-dependent hydrolase
MKRRVKRAGIVGLGVIGVISIAAVVVSMITHGPNVAESRPVRNTGRAEPEAPAEKQPATLKIITLNVAHGRCDGRHQALLSTKTIRKNLDRIARVLVREAPDVVALQEADGPAIWSGNFDHVDYLATRGDFAHHFRGEHVKGLRLSYGTALVSRLPLGDCASTTFARSPPTLSKGFVTSSIAWPKQPNTRVTIVSVHLDFARAAVRGKQVQRLAAQLKDIKGPIVVMGDFNCEWQGRESSLRTLAAELGLRAYQPTADGMATFPGLGKRLDWILISPGLEFVSYARLGDTLSDHLGVAAELRLVDEAE